MDLRTIQRDYTVRPILRSVPGVTEVESFGGLVKQYQVIVGPDRLAAYDLALKDVFRRDFEKQCQRQRQFHRTPERAVGGAWTGTGSDV